MILFNVLALTMGSINLVKRVGFPLSMQHYKDWWSKFGVQGEPECCFLFYKNTTQNTKIVA